MMKFLAFFLVLFASFGAHATYVPTTGGGGSSLFTQLSNPVRDSLALYSTGAAVAASPMYKSVGQCSFYDYLVSGGVSVSGLTSTTRTDYLNKFLLDCQNKYLTMVGNTSWDNLTFPTGITAVIPNLSGDFGINSMIVVPRYVHTQFFAQPVRVGNVGTPSTDWPSSSTGQSLANLYMPMIWFMPGSGEDPSVPLKAHLYSTAGVDYGSGVAYGGFLQIKGVTVANGGSGMVNGETCRIQSGDLKQPYGSPTVVITVTSGAVTGVTYTGAEFANSAGAFGLLPYMQAYQWTAANGWNNGVGTYASPVTYKPTVFDGGGHYLLNCPSGSQTASVDLTWYKAFEHAYFEPKFANSVGYGGIAYTDYVGDIYTDQGDPASAISGTYGEKIGFQGFCHDCTLGRIENSIGSDIGFLLVGTDIRSTGGLNSVGAGVCGVIRSGGGLTADIVCDTNRVSGLHISNYDNFQIRLNSFHNSTSAATFVGPLLYMGNGSYGGGATQLVSNGQVDLTAYSSGTGGSALTAVTYDYATADNQVNVNASNVAPSGSARNQLISTVVSYTANALGGSITGIGSAASDATLVSGTPPAASSIEIKNTTTGHILRGAGGTSQMWGGATGYTNTGIDLNEVCVASVALPPMGAQDQLRISTYWTKGGTLTNTTTPRIRLNTAGCTPGTDSSAGTSIFGIAQSTSSSTSSFDSRIVANRNATNSQVTWVTSSFTNTGINSGALATAAVQTNATPYINFTCQTNTSTADTCKLESYTIELLKP